MKTIRENVSRLSIGALGESRARLPRLKPDDVNFQWPLQSVAVGDLGAGAALRGRTSLIDTVLANRIGGQSGNDRQ